MRGGVAWWRRRQAAALQAAEHHWRLPLRANGRWQTGQVIVAVSSRHGGLGTAGSSAIGAHRLPDRLSARPMRPHPVRGAVDIYHDAAVQ